MHRSHDRKGMGGKRGRGVSPRTHLARERSVGLPGLECLPAVYPPPLLRPGERKTWPRPTRHPLSVPLPLADLSVDRADLLRLRRGNSKASGNRALSHQQSLSVEVSASDSAGTREVVPTEYSRGPVAPVWQMDRKPAIPVEIGEFDWRECRATDGPRVHRTVSEQGEVDPDGPSDPRAKCQQWFTVKNEVANRAHVSPQTPSLERTETAANAQRQGTA